MAWSHLQAVGATASTGNPAATFTTANLTAGSKMIAYVALNAGSGTISCTAVKDGSSNSFTQVGADNITSPSIMSLSIWELDTPAGDVGTKPTITATNSASNGGSILVQEVSGLASGATIDGSAAFLAFTGNGGTQAWPSYTTTASNEYLVEVFSDLGDSNIFTPSRLTDDTHGAANNGNADLQVAYGNSGNGSETGNWGNLGNGLVFLYGAVAFKLPPAIPGSVATVAGQNASHPNPLTGVGLSPVVNQAVRRGGYY